MRLVIIAILLAFLAVTVLYEDVHASVVPSSKIRSSGSESVIQEPSGSWFLGLLWNSIVGNVGLTKVKNILEQLDSAGLLSGSLDLYSFLQGLPMLLLADPVQAFTSLFANLGDVTTALQQLAVGRLTCTGCFFGIGIIKFLQAVGTSDDATAQAVIGICVTFQLYSEKVCTGIVNAQKHMLLTSLKNSRYNVAEVCGFLVANGCGKEPEEGKWEIIVPGNKQPPKTYTPPEADFKKLVFLHFTDPHVDANYTKGTPSNCKDPLCCHANSPTSASNLVAGTYGGGVNCDIPYSTMRAVFQNARDIYGEPAGVFYTGDQPPHDLWYETRKNHESANAGAAAALQEFYSNSEVYPAIGNHDSFPSNSFPIELPVVPGMDNVSWLYDQAVKLWIPTWLPVKVTKTVKRGAFYSVPTKHKGLRVISLNNNMCYFLNFWLLINATDPFDQLVWLTNELQKAESRNEKVFLLMHIPPGYDDCLRMWSKNFYKIVVRFANTIVGQFSGHTHWDQFMVYYDENGNPVNVMYVAPSLTSYDMLNIAYRAIIVDAATYEVEDIVTHYSPLDQSNANGSPIVEKLYSAKNAYDMKSLQPVEWNNLINKLYTNNTLWQKYIKYFSRDSPYYPVCDDSCRRGLICQLKSARSRDQSQCPDISS